MSVPSLKRVLQSYSLLRSVQILISNLRKAQSLAMGLKDYYGAKIYGYGISLDSNGIFLFVDCNNNGTLQDGNVCQRQGGPNLPEKISSINLEKGVTIDKLTQGGINVNSLHILFLPPRGQAKFNGTFNPNSQASIVLKNSLNETKTIYIKSNGLIYSQ